jgi:cysteine-rich repeat protein
VVPPIGSGSLSTTATSSLVGALDDYNSGKTGPGHCGDQPPPPPPPSCGNGKLEQGEQCDDGNTVSGDGCSSTCTIEPVCGNGKLEAGEQCDDGNTVDGDGCSHSCTLEPPPPPVCGNGKLEIGEQCDDGNTVNGDGCSSSCQFETCGSPGPA